MLREKYYMSFYAIPAIKQANSIGNKKDCFNNKKTLIFINHEYVLFLFIYKKFCKELVWPG